MEGEKELRSTEGRTGKSTVKWHQIVFKELSPCFHHHHINHHTQRMGGDMHYLL